MADKTWYADANVATTDTSTLANAQKNAIWLIKAMLTGQVGTVTQGLWTVVGSSDGTTAALDGVDRWGATFNAAKLVNATGAVAHSWIVLQSPAALGHYVLLSLNVAASRDIAWTFSPVAFTGGSITVDPASTKPISMTSAASSANLAVHKCSRVTDVDGNFWLFVGQTGTGKVQFLLGLQKLMDFHASDTNPVVACWQFDESTGDTIARSSGVWNSASVSATSPAFRARSANSGAASVELAALVPSFAGSFPFNSTEIATTDAADGSYGYFPTYVYAMTASHKSIRGRLPDVGTAPASTGTGVVSPASGPLTNVCVGGSWFPWAGSVAPAW
jgi:hypothetical protein